MPFLLVQKQERPHEELCRYLNKKKNDDGIITLVIVELKISIWSFCIELD